jgi:heme exporter protein CcmD
MTHVDHIIAAGSYDLYIAAAYGMSFIVMVFVALSTVRARARVKAELRGIERRK